MYRPLSEVRFVYGGHTGDNYCFGLEQLPSKGDLLFLTGGEKGRDDACGSRFPSHLLQLGNLGNPGEPSGSLVYRFKHIVLLYDTDKTGLECSEKHRVQLSEYGVKRLVLPLPGTKSEKDVTDYFKAGHTREDLMGLFLKLLDTLYGDTMAVLKSCEIDYDCPPEQAVAIVTAGDVPLGSEENILCITGGEGTGKSNYTAALVAGGNYGTGGGRGPSWGEGGTEPKGACGAAVRHGTERATGSTRTQGGCCGVPVGRKCRLTCTCTA